MNNEELSTIVKYFMKLLISSSGKMYLFRLYDTYNAEDMKKSFFQDPTVYLGMQDTHKRVTQNGNYYNNCLRRPEKRKINVGWHVRESG